MYILIFATLIVLNVVTFAVYGIDKSRAISGKWRVPEKTLLLLAAVGGSIGAFLGMKFFHHKTMKPKFFIGIPTMVITQGVFVYYINTLL